MWHIDADDLTSQNSNLLFNYGFQAFDRVAASKRERDRESEGKKEREREKSDWFYYANEKIW